MRHTDEQIAAMTPAERERIRRSLSAGLMSDAIAAHGSGGLSRRTKRAMAKWTNAKLAEYHRYDEPPPEPDRRAELLAKATQVRSYLTMASKSQHKKLIAQAEELERQAALLE